MPRKPIQTGKKKTLRTAPSGSGTFLPRDLESRPPDVSTLPEYRVAERYQIDRVTLYRAVEDQRVRAYSVNGRVGYVVDDLEAVFGPQAQAEAHDYRAESLNTVANLTAELTEMCRELRIQNGQLHEAILKPIKEGMSFLSEICGRQSDRIRELEQGWVDMFSATQELLNASADRDLMKKQAENREKRRDDLVAWFKSTAAPSVLDAWSKQSDMKRLFRSIPSDLRADFYSILSEEWQQVARSVAPPPEAKPSTGSETEETGRSQDER